VAKEDERNGRFVLSSELAELYRQFANSVVVAASSDKLETFARAARYVVGIVHPEKFPLQEAVDRLWATAEAAGLVAKHGDDVVQIHLSRAFESPIFFDPECPGALTGMPANMNMTAPTPNGPCDEQLRKESADHGGSGKPEEEYNVEKMNQRYAVVKAGRLAMIYDENPGAPVDEQLRMLDPGAFKLWFENTSTDVVVDRRQKRMTHAERWLKDPQRRQYEGVTFFPDPYNKQGCVGYLNLWRGFAYAPAANSDRRKYTALRDHLLNNVCRGNEEHYRYIFGWFAQMFQCPRERPGVALVIRGDKGAGKTKIGEIFGALLGRHYLLVDSPRYMTGNFNAHLRLCVLLQADEALWAGDKTVEGRLKGLITAPVQQIEAKGIDPVQLPNYVHVLMTSNADAVVPASRDERRYAVFDIDPRCVGNISYFVEMTKEMNDGGFEHLLADLLGFDLTIVDLRRPPQTAALLDQKFEALDSVDRWWLNCLERGSLTRSAQCWESVIVTERLYDEYATEAERVGHRWKSDDRAFGKSLAKLLKGSSFKKGRATVVADDKTGATTKQRRKCYFIPRLAEARECFDRHVGDSIDWPEADDDAAGAGGDDDVV
jgi:Family of unknown function (DUF5906)